MRDPFLDIVALSENRATADDTWTVSMTSSMATGNLVTITAYAICLQIP